MRWIVILLALQQAGWMAYDGGRALAVGDYVTPSSGPYAGQLGPWSKLVAQVGIEPRSTLMKSIFLGTGVVWLGVLVAYVLRRRRAGVAMLLMAGATLWYLPFGTLSSAVQIGLLLWLRKRARAATA